MIPHAFVSLYPWLWSPRPSADHTMREIAARVAARHGTSLADLRGCSTQRSVAKTRHEAFAEIYGLGRYSTTQIGRFFGDRDHTTVIYGIRRHHSRQAAERMERAA